MTDAADAQLRALAELVTQVGQTLQAGDDAAARTRAAAQVERLRQIAEDAERQRAPGSPAIFDVAQVTDALAQLAEWLRAPSSASEASARDRIAELQRALGPLVGGPPVRDEAAERAHHRQEARAALDDHFRANPVKPIKP